MNAAPEMNRTALKVGEVEADDVFVVGNDGEDDDSGPDVGAGDIDVLPGYAERDEPSSQTALEEIGAVFGAETGDAASTPAPTGYSKSEYWIKPGDSLMGIALKYGVDVSASALA